MTWELYSNSLLGTMFFRDLAEKNKQGPKIKILESISFILRSYAFPVVKSIWITKKVNVQVVNNELGYLRLLR